jgi:hypothetical protein
MTGNNRKRNGIRDKGIEKETGKIRKQTLIINQIK